MIDVSNRKEAMVEMYKEGLNYKEIGEHFGVSRQRVYQLIGGRFKRQFKPITADVCIYPNLKEWMNDNRVNIPELCRRIHGYTHPVLLQSVYDFLKGKVSRVTKDKIDKYLGATGLTYEELFETD